MPNVRHPRRDFCLFYHKRPCCRANATIQSTVLTAAHSLQLAVYTDTTSCLSLSFHFSCVHPFTGDLARKSCFSRTACKSHSIRGIRVATRAPESYNPNILNYHAYDQPRLRKSSLRDSIGHWTPNQSRNRGTSSRVCYKAARVMHISAHRHLSLVDVQKCDKTVCGLFGAHNKRCSILTGRSDIIATWPVFAHYRVHRFTSRP
ncbi:hypothetical protein DAEQUDRAFT_572093 [Daedalea quercina L-15889]|uniref:Uncharacterized protein n=1 Tax=Daedalea quercina L-15889 TaxID=1314783 RepID=A0A165LV43_9APHY|nr:hypothetical protein DAEQUDRAFT_572093 [Daedalea quercina L-15889]